MKKRIFIGRVRAIRDHGEFQPRESRRYYSHSIFLEYLVSDEGRPRSPKIRAECRFLSFRLARSHCRWRVRWSLSYSENEKFNARALRYIDRAELRWRRIKAAYERKARRRK